MTTPPKPPTGTKAAGRRLWSSLLTDYTFEEHELALLREMTRTVDLLQELAAIAEREGLMVDGRMHPALIEARQQKIALSRLAASLRLPSGEEEQQGGLRRPQRRGAARGAYRPRLIS